VRTIRRDVRAYTGGRLVDDMAVIALERERLCVRPSLLGNPQPTARLGCPGTETSRVPQS
jgi:hypothetical protein